MIKTVLFDVDGVLLSEEHYFDASALTVWELLISNNYLGLAPENFKTNYSAAEIKTIRENVFGKNDDVLKLMKSRGLNANWDMIYLSFGHQLIHLLSQIKEKEDDRINSWLQEPIDREVLLEMGRVLQKYEVNLDFDRFISDFAQSTETKQELFNYLNQLASVQLGVQTTIFSGISTLWSVCEHTSQEWYVGDENVEKSTGRPSVQLGKKGFLANETTLADKAEIQALFTFLKESGVKIGIGTGRPELETIQPFHHLDWLKLFDVNYIVTADDVLKAENELVERQSLSKPHPFTYIMGLNGRKTSVETCLNTPLPIEKGEEVLVVGDSLADLLAARKMGCQFAAVLTGLSGKDARSDFEKYEADYILDTVLDVRGLIERN
ncbi:phosphoglycolate phosphatase-like HAD superfamily hydrolase [Bacillus niacini]|uniref:Phosphoglycolate phosphatase-like HAD superfamily hydrolase n=1 Tax=Neobacillus niacini TaxID=86668 RepID=A0A852T7W1_9BACI|nr:HAD family hydrolase [Neobacillus niacini]NYE03899.1 phosphoglycolate phosphatase-like HAD superfamily hydrolase [Neobacillus niacini]